MQRPDTDRVSLAIRACGSSSCGEGDAFFVHFREGGPAVTDILLPVAFSLSEAEEDDPPKASRGRPEDINAEKVTWGDQVRPISVQTSAFRISCGGYVRVVGEGAGEVPCEEPVGFL